MGSASVIPKAIYAFLQTMHAAYSGFRKIALPTGRLENNAEHSWGVAMMTWIVSSYHDEAVDLAKALKMALMHDLVEIISGDTPAFDKSDGKQREREDAAAIELFSTLPAPLGPELMDLWFDFADLRSPEARLVKYMDRLHPVLLNICTKGFPWKWEKVPEQGVRNHKQIVANHGGAVKELLDRLMADAVTGKLFGDPK